MPCKLPRRVRQPLPEGTPPGRGAKPGEHGQAAFVPTAERTLSRHFAEELATGKLLVHAGIATGIVEAALNGDKTMMVLYVRPFTSKFRVPRPEKISSSGRAFGRVAPGGQARSDYDVSRPCSIYLHPRRREAEELLWRGWSIRRVANENGGVRRRCTDLDATR
jgi:hypothetical protein